MATTGPDAVLTLSRALTDPEREEAFERICQLRVADAAECESDMARYLRSLARVAELVGRTPTVTDYKEAQSQLAAAGEPIEPFTRIYAFFGGVWARAREALALSETTTPRRIEARFRSRQLGKVWRYTDESLRDALMRAAEQWSRPPSVAEFEWWRENELRRAQATGDGQLQLPMPARTASAGAAGRRPCSPTGFLLTRSLSGWKTRRRRTTKGSTSTCPRGSRSRSY
jgi:hypothetical protein